jgi:hypothetical protein
MPASILKESEDFQRFSLEKILQETCQNNQFSTRKWILEEEVITV